MWKGCKEKRSQLERMSMKQNIEERRANHPLVSIEAYSNVILKG